MTNGQMSDEQIAQKLAESLQSTSRGLTAFSSSVQGLKEALKPYQHMQVVLLQQRLWSRNHDRQDLDPLWKRIAASSRELHSVFAGFAGVMDALRSIDTLEEAGDEAQTGAAAQTQSAQADEELVRWTETALQNFKLGPSRLREFKPKLKTAASLQKLVQSKVLEPCGRGSYRFTAKARRRLATVLAEMSRGESAHT